jgi:hypothetical protein
MLVIQAPPSLRQEDFEFKINQGYTAGSKPLTGYIQRGRNDSDQENSIQYS